jgi:PKD repeat protein
MPVLTPPFGATMHRLAAHVRNRRSDRSRGQSLVEFALVLPIIMFLTLTALDFGRVYLGYINLQNMARIAANFAANNPDAWTGLGDADKKISYQNQILGDAAATNCDLPTVSGTKTAPAPTFTDADADGKHEIGDTAEVSLTCTFNVITPVIANVVGGSLQVSASSVFPVKSGMTADGSSGGGGGTPPVADFTGNGTVAPSSLSGVAPFTVVFRDTSGGAPTSWFWEFPDDGTTSTLRDPLGHTFQNPGTYVVQMTATNSLGSSSETQSITVTSADEVNFEGVPTSIVAGETVTFTDMSSAGGTGHAWTFGTGEGTGTGTTPTHTYNTVGTYEVTLTVTYATGDKTLSRPAYINVGSGGCVVPSLDKTKRSDANGKWSANGFTGTVSDGPGAPNNDYMINTQSLTAASTVPCNSNIVVNKQ